MWLVSSTEKEASVACRVETGLTYLVFFTPLHKHTSQSTALSTGSNLRTTGRRSTLLLTTNATAYTTNTHTEQYIIF